MHTDDVETKHRKKRPAKKPFVIESRTLPELKWSWRSEWATHSRYHTEKQREQALADLREKTYYDQQMFEYRAKP